MALTQEDLLRQQQEKLAGIEQQQGYNLFRSPGVVQGETPDQFAAGKQAANSQTGAVSQPFTPTQPTNQPAPVVNTQNSKVAPKVDPTSAISGMDALAAMYTSPEQEERMRKSSLANMRIMAVADALRHIGNIYHTTQSSPSQQFNSPVADEYAHYQRGKAMRDAANLKYYTYQQQKAMQDAKQRQWEAENVYKNKMLAHYNDQDRRLWAKQGETANYHLALIDLRKQQQALDDAYKKGKLDIDRYNAESRRISARAAQLRAGAGGGGGQGGKYWAYDEEGNIHYYPNKSMYEQGVYEFGQGQSTSEEYNKGTDVLGRPQTGVRKRSVTSMGGERARQARNKGTKKPNPMGGNNNGKKKNPMS